MEKKKKRTLGEVKVNLDSKMIRKLRESDLKVRDLVRMTGGKKIGKYN